LDYHPLGNKFINKSLSSIVVYAQDNRIYVNNVAEQIHITIADITGRVFVSASIRENASFTLSSGMYIVSISDTKEYIKTVKCLVV
jgi:DNA-binding transcriptional regulator/RsmH inhibitor MraZ